VKNNRLNNNSVSHVATMCVVMA